MAQTPALGWTPALCTRTSPISSALEHHFSLLNNRYAHSLGPCANMHLLPAMAGTAQHPLTIRSGTLHIPEGSRPGTEQALGSAPRPEDHSSRAGVFWEGSRPPKCAGTAPAGSWAPSPRAHAFFSPQVVPFAFLAPGRSLCFPGRCPWALSSTWKNRF